MPAVACPWPNCGLRLDLTRVVVSPGQRQLRVRVPIRMRSEYGDYYRFPGGKSSANI